MTPGGLPCDSANNAYAASWITGVTRDAARPWDNAGSYRWYAGPSSWTASPGSAVSVIAGARPLSVTVNNFSALGHGLVLIEQTNIVGGFTVYQASRPSGTWREKTSGTVPCTIEGDSFCRAIIGHPELSTRSHLVVSFFQSGRSPALHHDRGRRGSCHDRRVSVVSTPDGDRRSHHTARQPGPSADNAVRRLAALSQFIVRGPGLTSNSHADHA